MGEKGRRGKAVRKENGGEEQWDSFLSQEPTVRASGKGTLPTNRKDEAKGGEM